jgi:O-antigen/teichoic acid export membrane protein
VASIVTALATVSVVARAEGENRFGSWTVAVAAVGGLLILDLGLGNALVRTTGRLRAAGQREHALDLLATGRRRAARRISGPIAAIGVAGAVIAAATGTHTDSLDTSDLWTTILAVGLVAPALALLGMAAKVRTGLGEIRQSSTFGIIGCIAQLAVVALGVAASLPLGALVAANFTSQLVGWGLDSFALRRQPDHPPTPAPDDELLVAGRRFQVLTIAGYAGFNADALLVGAIVSPAAAGLVGLAARVVLTPQIVVTAWFSPRWGSIARTEVEAPDQVRPLVLRTIGWAGATTAAVSVVAGLIAQPVVDVIAGSNYTLSTGLVWATVAAGVVLGIASAIAFVMNGLGLVSAQLRLAVASAAANIAIGALLCLRIGAVGAPLATALAHGLIGIPMAAIAVHARLQDPPVHASRTTEAAR